MKIKVEIFLASLPNEVYDEFGQLIRNKDFICEVKIAGLVDICRVHLKHESYGYMASSAASFCLESRSVPSW